MAKKKKQQLTKQIRNKDIYFQKEKVDRFYLQSFVLY